MPQEKNSTKLVVRQQADRHLKTPQSLIHIRHTISLLQYKLWILLLQEFKRQFDSGEPADEKGFRYVSMDYLEQHLGYSPSRQDLLEDLRVLRKEEICFNYLEKDGYKAQYFAGFISEVKATRLTVGFKFPSILDDVMLGLDDAKAIFQLLNWNVFNHFSGKYEAIIYKLCKDYIGIGRTPYLTLNEIRVYMGLKVTEYALFEDFNKFCLKKPIALVNASEISDIVVDVVYNRNGRKVVGLYFTVRSKQQAAFPLVEPQFNPAFTCAKVTISVAEQQGYLKAYSAEQISLSIERANEYCEDLEKKRKNVNYGAIYKIAITENWGAQLQERKALEAEQKAARQKLKKEKVKEDATSNDASPSTECLVVNKALLERFRLLPEAAQHSLVEDCIKAQKDPLKAMAKKNYAAMKLGVLEKPFFVALFCPFLQKHWNEQSEAVV